MQRPALFPWGLPRDVAPSVPRTAYLTPARPGRAHLVVLAVFGHDKRLSGTPLLDGPLPFPPPPRTLDLKFYELTATLAR